MMYAYRHFVWALLIPSFSHHRYRISRPIKELDSNSRDTDIDFDGAERHLEEDNDYSVEMMEVSCLDREEMKNE